MHFTATLADEQGRQITGKIEDCTLFKMKTTTLLTELKDGKFTPEVRADTTLSRYAAVWQAARSHFR